MYAFNLHLMQFSQIDICFRTSWEFPEIVSGKFNMISDADGKQYPWYGAKRELSQLDGPCNKQSLTLEMNDNFFPQVVTKFNIITDFLQIEGFQLNYKF